MHSVMHALPHVGDFMPLRRDRYTGTSTKIEFLDREGKDVS